MENNKRKGARTQKDIPTPILEQLNKGIIESVNLTEWLAVNHLSLIEQVLPSEYQPDCIRSIDELKSKSVMSMIKAIGKSLCKQLEQKEDNQLLGILGTHISDSVRCWAAYIIGSNIQLSVEEKLQLIHPFAADLHFGVREISWMAVREDINKNLERIIPILEIWSKDEDANIRRFSSESIRPNGVWSRKIEKLKDNPEIALCILENLKSDSSKYVQDSVGNWLNDAGKTKPEFVIELCKRWEKENQTTATTYIIKRALRTLNK